MDAFALDGLHFRTRNGHWVLKCGTGLKTAWFIRGAWSMFWDAWLDIPPARRVIRSVFATAGLDATGDVTATAGHASVVSRGGQISGPVTGGRHAGIVAFGPVSASVNAASGDAASGDAFVVTWGAVSNTVTAGGSAFVSAGDGGSVTVHAAADAAVTSFGPLMAFVQTGRDGYVWTFDRYHGNVFAGGDAMIVSLGAVNAGIFAGGSGLIYAVENAIGSVTASEYAGVITWGTAAGPMTVTGPLGAFGWSYGDFNGFVESSAGSASLTSYGNAMIAVRGAQDASLWVVGQWVGDIQAGDDAVAVALGGFHGHLTGSITAGRNVGAATDTGLPTGSAYPIFSYGQISADISALNPAGVTGGGHIGPIGAWGAIAGRIEAADTIHEIRSGDSVSATLIAPNVPVPSEFDSTIETDHPLPALPDSVVGEILAQAATEHAAVLATKAQVAADIADLLADFATEKAAAATGLTDAITQATANAATAEIDAAIALAADWDEATVAMDAAVAAAAAELAGLQDAVEDSASSLEADRDQMQQSRSDAYAQVTSLASQVAAAMTESDTTIDDSRSIVLNASTGLRASRETNWENIRQYLASSTLAGWYHFPPPPDPPAGPSSRFTYSHFALVAVMHDLNDPARQMAADRSLQGIAIAVNGFETLAYLTGPGNLLLSGYKGYAGKDLLGRELTMVERMQAAHDVAMVLSPVLCSISQWMICFTAETEVQVPEKSGGVWYATSAGVFTVGMAALLLARPPSRRRKRQPGRKDSESSNVDGEIDTPVDGDLLLLAPGRDLEPSDELCDRLFHGTESELWWNASEEGGERPLPEWSVFPARCGYGALAAGQADPMTLRAAATQPNPPRAQRRSRPRPAPKPTGKFPQSPRSRGVIGFAVSFLVAALCLLQGWRESRDTTRTIGQLRVGQKVITDAPTEALAAAERDLPMVGPTRQERLDPATWKLIRLRALVRWDDGTWDDINVETLQPPSWLAAHDVRVGGLGPIPLDLEELGLPYVPGKVLAIEPCPPVAPGPGRVILTTVNHLNADVDELTIRDASGRQETIRTTGGHKFYSATRTAWLSATDLEPGEHLDGLTGPLEVVALQPLPGVHRVYNLTVEGDHVYRVSPLAALVHNDKCKGKGPREVARHATNLSRNAPNRGGQLSVPQKVFTSTDVPADLARAKGTFVTEIDITHPRSLVRHVQGNVPPAPGVRPPGSLPRYVTEIDVPRGSVLPDPTVPFKPNDPTGWLPSNAPGAVVREVYEVIEDALGNLIIRPLGGGG